MTEQTRQPPPTLRGPLLLDKRQYFAVFESENSPGVFTLWNLDLDEKEGTFYDLRSAIVHGQRRAEEYVPEEIFDDDATALLRVALEQLLRLRLVAAPFTLAGNPELDPAICNIAAFLGAEIPEEVGRS